MKQNAFKELYVEEKARRSGFGVDDGEESKTLHKTAKAGGALIVKPA